MLILFDIDGTVADGAHREVLLRGETPDWAAFLEASKYDPAFPAMKAFVNLAVAGGWDLVFATGRSDVFRPMTRRWLDGVLDQVNPALFMRDEHDTRHDVDVKRDMLAAIQNWFGRMPDMAFEDRLPVAEMYREHGIYTCHVANGDPWAGKPFPSGDALRALVPPA